MAAPADPTARLFRRAAAARREEADVLFAAGHGTGAVYLAGYAVECGFKALLISATPRPDRAVLLDTFRGRRGHDLDGLRREYVLRGGPWLPEDVANAFNDVVDWSTDLRYSAKKTPRAIAADFLAATDAVLAWINGRI